MAPEGARARLEHSASYSAECKRGSDEFPHNARHISDVFTHLIRMRIDASNPHSADGDG